MIKGFLSKLFSRQRYETIAVFAVSCDFMDSSFKHVERTEHVIFTLQENMYGNRLLHKKETDSASYPAEKSKAYREYLLPWREYQLEALDLYSHGVAIPPHIFSRLGYKLLGQCSYQGRYPDQDEDDPNIKLNYFFYEHENGQRRLTKHCSGSKNLGNSRLELLYQSWEQGLIAADELEDFKAFDAPAPRLKAKDVIQSRENNIVNIEFPRQEQ